MAASSPFDQPDALGAEPQFKPYGADQRQLDMFGAPPVRSYGPDPGEVRAELAGILAKARAAPQVPWPAREMALWGTVFPQMANWLPEAESTQLRLEFETELARLEAAA